MKSKFSKSWKGSKQPRKQRKYTANAPLHIKRKMIASRLSKELTKKHSKRSMVVRKGDVVNIVRGNFKKHAGKIDTVFTKHMRVHIEGIQNVKRDGNKTFYPIHASNLVITQLNLEDKKRQAILERVKKSVEDKNDKETLKNN
jgi:large subunit ribosomal protein L24